MSGGGEHTRAGNATARGARTCDGSGPGPRGLLASRAAVWAFVALAALAWFGTLGYRHLIHPDEGRYAELARHMLVSGDWVTPRLNGILYFEKPVLQYWATAVGFALLGIGEAGARLWPALCGVIGIAAVWVAARRALGATVAAVSASVLGGCAWWILNSHFVNLDTGLACFMALAMLGFWIAQRDDASPREARLGMLAAWASMGLAVLSKGLVGIVLPGAVLVAYTIAARDLSIWRRMRWLEGLAAFLALTAPWFVLVSMRNPEFAHFFFVHEHFQRFTTTQHARTGAWWYFVPILAAGLAPWTTLLPGALLRGWRRQPGRFQANRLFIVWALTIFLFFSASGSKLPSYILPIFPALALLVAQHVAAMPARRLAWHTGAMLVLSIALWVLLYEAPHLFDRSGSLDPEALAYRDWLLAGSAALAAAAALATGFARSDRRLASVMALAGGSLVACQLFMLGHQSYAPLKSARTMVEAVRGAVDPAEPFYSIRTHDQTLPFYLGRPVTLVDWTDEFATGLRIEPQLRVTLEQFESRWQRARPGTAAMMNLREFARLEQAGLPMRVVYRDAGRLVAIRP